MRNIFHKIGLAFWHQISPFTVLLSGIYSFMWGFWVFLPFWDSFSTSPVFMFLGTTQLSEILWGGTQMLVGVALFLASFESYRFIKYATFAGFISWTLISLAFALSNWQNPAIWVAGYLAVTNAYMFLNVAIKYDVSN